jgi:hypothetical protein
MPATVKSLEERIDEMAESFSTMRMQLGIMLGNQSSTQVQLASILNNEATAQAQSAVLVAKLDNVLDQLKLTNAKLEESIRLQDSLKTEHTALKAKTENTIGLLRWAGVTSVGVLLTVFLAAFSVVRAAGQLESKVDHHEKMLEELKSDLRKSKQP